MTYTDELKAQLPQLLQALADPRDDMHWAQWLRAKPRAGHDLIQVLRAPARPGIKARALLTLLVPSVDLLPFTWYVQGARPSVSRR